MYSLLYSALKNVGDFLIYDRAKTLLIKHKGMHEYIEFHARKGSLDQHLERVNKTKAVIVCGGPGCLHNLYPDKYPLVRDLSDIRVPIILFGIGWYGVPGDDVTLERYSFSPSTKALFRRINKERHSIGVRDYLTQKVLLRNGLDNVSMIGCPSWYDLDHLEEEFTPVKKVEKVVFTPPAKDLYRFQAVKVMEMLRKLFPKGTLICSFHRGIKSDAQTPNGDAEWLTWLASKAEDLEYQVVDVSYDTSNIRFYSDCDLHVGYRVHAHIYFLAKRKPSFLIHEDGRGRGVSEAIGLQGIQGWERTVIGHIAPKVGQGQLSRVAERLKVDVKADGRAVSRLEEFIMEEMENGFARFSGLSNVFQRHYQTMKDFLAALP